MAEEITSRTISVIENRLNGIPRSAGSWQASAFICAISSGGKKEWSAISWFIHKPMFSFIEKAFTPLANCLSWKIKSFTNFFILIIPSSKKNYLCSKYVPIRCRIFSGQESQVLSLSISQNNFKWTLSRHDIPLSYRRYHTPISVKSQQIIRNINCENTYLVILFPTRNIFLSLNIYQIPQMLCSQYPAILAQGLFLSRLHTNRR